VGGACGCAELGPGAIGCSVVASTGMSIFLNEKVDRYDLRTKLANGIQQVVNDMNLNGFPIYNHDNSPQPEVYAPWDPFLNPTMDPFKAH